jgi:hypothetical protein
VALGFRGGRGRGVPSEPPPLRGGSSARKIRLVLDWIGWRGLATEVRGRGMEWNGTVGLGMVVGGGGGLGVLLAALLLSEFPPTRCFFRFIKLTVSYAAH